MIAILHCPSHKEGSFYQNIEAPALSPLIVSHEVIQLVPLQNNFLQGFNVGNIKMFCINDVQSMSSF